MSGKCFCPFFVCRMRLQAGFSRGDFRFRQVRTTRNPQQLKKCTQLEGSGPIAIVFAFRWDYQTIKSTWFPKDAFERNRVLLRRNEAKRLGLERSARKLKQIMAAAAVFWEGNRSTLPHVPVCNSPCSS